MKKYFAVLFASVIMLVSLYGCSDGDTPADATTERGGYTGTEIAQPEPLAAETLADLLYTSISFDDTMTKVTSDASKNAYGLYDYTGDFAIYVGTGATPEEIAVFKVDGDYTSEVIVEAANSRIEQQKESYADYAPAEVPKLDSAVVHASGDFVVVCVSADNASAENLINECI